MGLFCALHASIAFICEMDHTQIMPGQAHTPKIPLGGVDIVRLIIFSSLCAATHFAFFFCIVSALREERVRGLLAELFMRKLSFDYWRQCIDCVALQRARCDIVNE
jgi:hypothetical protein